MNNRIYYYDFLNIIATIAVLALHHNGIVHNFTATSSWNQALIIEVICYWAVPIFFMLSGATLMEYRNKYSTKNYFIQRIKRTFLPFLLWSIFWAILYCYWHKEIPSFFTFIYRIFNTEYQGVYWFFIPLFGLYILLPIVSKLKNEKKILLYFCAIIFIFEGLLKPLYRILEIDTIGGENSLAGPLFFLISGYLLNKTELKLNKTILIILTLFCFALRYIVTYKYSYINGETYRGLFGYYFFTSIIPSFTIFYIAKIYFAKNNNKRIQIILEKLSSYSLGVYLLHMFVIYFELKVLYKFNLDSSWWCYRSLMIFITYIVCIIIIHFTKKISLGKYIFP